MYTQQPNTDNLSKEIARLNEQYIDLLYDISKTSTIYSKTVVGLTEEAAHLFRQVPIQNLKTHISKIPIPIPKIIISNQVKH